MARHLADTPQYGVVSATLAVLYMNQGHYERAAETYRSLLEKEPDSAEHRSGLSTALARMEAVAEKHRHTEKIATLKAWLAAIKKDAR